MNQFFEDAEANDGKYFEMETEPVSAVEKNNNSLPSTWLGFGGDENEPTSFVPSKWEIFEIVKYWRTQVLDKYWFYFITSASWSDMLRERKYAISRFELAEAAIGEEAVLAAIKQAYEEFKRVDPEWLWEIFENGPSELWEGCGRKHTVGSTSSIVRLTLDKWKSWKRSIPAT
jgi:hypothetical protein